MRRALVACLFVLGAVAPQAAPAQSYQQYSDGLVSVTVKKIVEPGQGIAFDVCAQLIRQEKVNPVEIHLNVWRATGGILAQASSVMLPEWSTLRCQRVALEGNASELQRWEISRLRYRR
jgi:hypothetical protein